MKRLYRQLLPLAAALCCCTAGCGDDTTDPGIAPLPPEEEPLTFEIAFSNRTRTGVDVVIAPSDDEAPYLYLVIPQARYEELGSDEALVAGDRKALEEMASAAGQTLETLLAGLLVSGRTPQPVSVSGLEAGEAYYLYAYGMTTAGVATSPVTKAPFETLPVTMVDCTFDLSLSATRTAVRIGVAPSDKRQYYYYELLSGDRYAELGATPESAARNVIAAKIAGWMALGAETVAEAVRNMALQGDHGYTYTGLESGATHHLFLCGVDLEGDICTEVTYRAVSTEPFAMSDNRISLRVGSVTWDSASVEAEPTNDDPYVLTVKPASELAGKSDEEIVAELVASYGDAIDSRTVRGRKSLACDRSLMPATGYEALAFGYEGGVTTALVREPFETAPTQETERVDFEFSSDGSEVTIVPSDPSALYLWGTIEEQYYQELYGGTPAGVRQFVTELIEAYIPDVYADAAEYVLSEGFRGTITEDTWLFDGTHRVYAVCMNPDGTFAADPVVWDELLEL